MKPRSCAIAAITAAVLIIGLIIVGVVLISQAYRESTIVPVIKMPITKMPSPNAYDYFVKAGKQLRLPKDWAKSYSNYSPAQPKAILSRNQSALATLRQGLPYDYKPPFKYSVDARYPENVLFRDTSYILRLESLARADADDWAGAMDSCLDGILIGEVSAHGDALMGRLIGIGSEHVCRNEAWEVIQHLTSAQARAAIARLDDIANRHTPIADAYREEKIRGLLSLQQNFLGKCKDPDFSRCSQLPNWIKRKTLVRYGEFMDEYIHTVQQRYGAKPPIPKLKQPGYLGVISGEAPANTILLFYCCICDDSWFADLRCQTKNRLLKTALALRAYKLEKGEYPDRLVDLVPAYLKFLPEDPFALKGSFGYRREGDKYVLWSVGPDSKDDHGKPIVNHPIAHSKAHLADEFTSKAESKGDIVAGVNDR